MDKTNGIKLIVDRNKHFYSGIIPSLVPSSTTIDCVAKPALVPWAVKVVTQKAKEDFNEIIELNPEFFYPNEELYPKNPFKMVRENIAGVIDNSKSKHRDIFKEAGENGSLTHQHINRFLCGHVGNLNLKR